VGYGVKQAIDHFNPPPSEVLPDPNLNPAPFTPTTLEELRTELVGIGPVDSSTYSPADGPILPSNLLTQSRDGDSAGVKPKSSNQMQKEVERGQAPKTIERVDKGVDRPGLKEKPHIHLEDGSALNNDGTWKHGGRPLTEAEKRWILQSGWKLPK
jgi:hypothetical protein